MSGGLKTVFDAVGIGAPHRLSPGTIEKRYRFNGGDPADPSNWERIE